MSDPQTEPDHPEPWDHESLVLNVVFLGPPLVFAGLIALTARHEALTLDPLSIALVVGFVVILIAFPLLRHGFRE